MSGSLGPATDPLSDVERVNVRRYCGYSMFGNGNSGEQGYRFFVTYGWLEFRMTNATDDELTQVRAFLATLATLESAIPALVAQLSTAEAAVWKANKHAVRDATNLYNQWRRQLCDFFGVPPGDGLRSPGILLVV